MKRIESLYIGRTYAGCLEGTPDTDIIIKGIKTGAMMLFGDHLPIVVLDPIPSAGLFDGKRMLPQWTHMASCGGPEIEKDDHGTHCIVIWFSEESIISTNSFNIFDKFDWNKNAKGFQY